MKAELHLPDKRVIQVLIKERHYRKLTSQLNELSFWDKIKLLFGSK